MKWLDIEKQKPEFGQICIVAAGKDKVAQHVALMWNGEGFQWVEEMQDVLDPFPEEVATHWIPFPADPMESR